MIIAVTTLIFTLIISGTLAALTFRVYKYTNYESEDNVADVVYVTPKEYEEGLDDLKREVLGHIIKVGEVVEEDIADALNTSSYAIREVRALRRDLDELNSAKIDMSDGFTVDIAPIMDTLERLEGKLANADDRLANADDRLTHVESTVYSRNLTPAQTKAQQRRVQVHQAPNPQELQVAQKHNPNIVEADHGSPAPLKEDIPEDGPLITDLRAEPFVDDAESVDDPYAIPPGLGVEEIRSSGSSKGMQQRQSSRTRRAGR